MQTTCTPTYLDTERLTITEIARTLRAELESIDDAMDYLHVSSQISYTAREHEPIGRYRWIACYAVTGGSEGHYVHVDRIYLATPNAREFTHEPLLLVKTFGGYEKACQIAAYIGRRLDV